MLEFQKNSKVLVVVAHPDDEVLGAGGTINKLVKENKCRVRCLILGEGITSRNDKRDTQSWEKELLIHRKNIKHASKIIGYEKTSAFDFPDNRFDSVDLLDIVKVIEKEKNVFKPDIAITHHSEDLNVDHRVTFNAVLTACRPLVTESVKNILTIETFSSTEWQEYNVSKMFMPNMFVEISKQNLQAKIKAMETYQYERRKYPHPRSPESLEIFSKRWGIVIGKKYAEAFKLIRGII
ncbi:MAG: PIG-L family deacetylase [Ignavibacteriae bacterium]|nr:PIG-L family deacetylase [Ignavibacteriota bacterium]